MITPPSLMLPGLRECTACTISGPHVNLPVPGYGPRPNKVMIVAQAPGRVENTRGIPLIGPSGQYLAEVMEKVGLDLNKVYRTNINKCWPENDRKAKAPEIRTCVHYFLWKEVREVDPDIIIAMGDTSYRVFLPEEKGSITQIQGNIYHATIEGRERIVIPCVHPAFVVRNPEANEWMLAKTLKIAKAVIEGKPIAQPNVLPFRETEATWEEIEAALIPGSPFGFDLETTGLHRRSEVVGIGVCTEPGNGLYYPTVDNDDARNKLQSIRRFLEDPDVPTYVTNAKYERTILYHGYCINMRGYECTMIQAWLLGDRPKGLKDGFHSEFGMEMGHIDLFNTMENRTRDWRGIKTLDMRKAQNANRAAVVKYGAQDPDATLRLYHAFNAELLKRPKVYDLYKNVELPFVEMIFEMEKNGMVFDPEVLVPFYWELQDYHRRSIERCGELAGEPFNPGSPLQSARILYDKPTPYQIPLPRRRRKGSTERPTGKVDLAAHIADNDLVRSILTARGVNKLIGYVTSLPTYIDDDGRIHTEMKQAVASTGRSALANPNLSNIPARKREDMDFDIEGAIIRKAFVAPAPNWCIAAPDLSQIEMRIAAHLSGDKAMITLLTEGDIHDNTTRSIYGSRYESASREERKDMRFLAKTIGFGVLYGLTPDGLVMRTPTLQISRKEAEEFINAFYRSYPKLRPWQQRVIASTRKLGYAETILGRRRYLPDITSRDFASRTEAERQAINVPVQGSAADYFKLSILRVGEWLQANGLRTRLVNQVHDEIVMEAPKEEIPILAAIVPEIMSNVMKLKLPVKVDMEIGPSWGELRKVDEWKDIDTWQAV